MHGQQLDQASCVSYQGLLQALKSACAAVGCVPYMAREAYSLGHSPQSDVFAWGLLLFEVAHLRGPFGDWDSIKMLRQARQVCRTYICMSKLHPVEALRWPSLTGAHLSG